MSAELKAEVDEFAFEHSSPLSLRQPSVLSSPPAPPFEDPDKPAFDYNVSGDPFDDGFTPSRLTQLSNDRRISGRSSISSFPASVLHHDLPDQRTPPRSSLPQRHESTGSYGKTPSPRRHRGFDSAFRRPSSIREMQLNDDAGDDTESIVSHRSRMSVRSHGSSYSTNTSPSKRSSRSTQKKSSSLKKEFPLILLHCTLLPPASNCPGPACDKDLFAAILPAPYRQRWTALQDRLGSAELRSRGILLPHPQEEYELLEERLLEALDLEKPRIQNSHYFDQGGDSGFESGSQTDGDVDGDDKCPDCGKHLQTRADKKWEIKVFAANGLMRGAAWSAAWRDMEKVDVEIGMWMPEDVRCEVSARLDALRAAEEEAKLQDVPEPRGEETYQDRRQSYERATPQPVFEVRPESLPGAWTTFLQDRRNIAIMVLSIMVLGYAMLHAQLHGQTKADRSTAPAAVVNTDTSVITSAETWTTTSVAHDPPLSLSAVHDVVATPIIDLEESTSFATEASPVPVIVHSPELPDDHVGETVTELDLETQLEVEHMEV